MPRPITIILDRDDLALRGRIGAYRKWANEPNPTAATAPARAAFLGKFEREVDPSGALTPEERLRRADFARRAHMATLARKSALARAKKAPAPAKADAQEVDRATDRTPTT